MLYVIRHGLTDWNKEYKLQGQTDIPLNEEGRKMAEEASKEFKGLNFDVVFSSPLKRARETAQILVGDLDIPIIYDDRLKEMNFGIYEGTQECFKIPNCPITVFFKNPEKYEGVEGGESMDDLLNRTEDFLEDKVYPLLKAGKNVLIVGHGAMNSSIVTNFYHWPRERFWELGIPNCQFLKLEQS